MVPQIITAASNKFTAKSRIGLEPVMDLVDANGSPINMFEAIMGRVNK